ncbi:NADH-quinone oxidoreductase subunit C [Streptomyces sp. NPDC005774]|uniref:NADH-quinone oxidoreductase subunit C n=1 Tax=Streptomyces sp. NPDC005774 TaxID=3364728 RepID=UPI0036C33D22
MTAAGWLPADAEELFGTEATAEESYDVLTVDVPPASWLLALETARDRLGCTYFDWLSAVDEPGTGFHVTAHVVALAPVRRLLLRTTVPHEAPALPSAVGVYAGAAWHERETYEMFGVDFTGHPALDHLLLPDTFEGHPLRKDFVLAARVAKAWPGAKEPGESEHGGPKRRQMLPPGVPDPNEWGPLKGRLPPAPSRPARGAGRTATGTGTGPGPAAGRAPGDRPPRRTRTAAEGSASQSVPAGTDDEGRPAPPPRRNRTAAEGSASRQAAPALEPPAADAAAQPGTPPSAAPRTRRARSASEGSASQREQSTAAASGTSEEAEKAAEDTVGSAAGPGPGPGPGPGTDAPEAPAVGRRTRSESEGSASQRPQASPSKPTDERSPRRARSASEGSASRPATPPDTTGTPGTATPPDTTGTSKETEKPDRTGASSTKPSTAPRSPDAPWHNARPAHAEPESDAAGELEPEAEAQTEPESTPAPDPGPDPEPGSSGPADPGTPSGGPR